MESDRYSGLYLYSTEINKKDTDCLNYIEYIERQSVSFYKYISVRSCITL